MKRTAIFALLLFAVTNAPLLAKNPADDVPPTSHPLDLVTSQHAPGDSIQVDVLRNGQTVHLTVVLGTRPATA